MSIETPGEDTIASKTENENQNKFLSFSLGKEEYGLEILRVREIIGVLDITPLPQTPDYVKGVINLRGKIIPVIELRRKFNMDSVDYTEETCVIVVEVTTPAGDEQFQMGVIVDNVSEVRNIARDQIEPAPEFGSLLNTGYILGMGKIKTAERTSVLILLDIDKVVSLEDLGESATHQIGSAETAEAAESDQSITTRAAA
ncbi:MAG: purine-binding chemotaxis protein CheW [Phycisphaerales bacterium]|jgi:purine-binding chemotaxis protein CheW